MSSDLKLHATTTKMSVVAINLRLLIYFYWVLINERVLLLVGFNIYFRKYIVE